MCFSSSREANRANFQAKFFPTVSNVIHRHIVDWKSVCLRSVHFYDRFTPGSIFNLKARNIHSNEMIKKQLQQNTIIAVLKRIGRSLRM